MARRINRKCLACAQLTVDEAIAQHGPTGDDCWNPADERELGYDCHRRRNHYRHREEDNRNRRRQRKLLRQGQPLPASIEPIADPIVFSPPTPPPIRAAVLVLYRNRPDAPVHGIAAEIWQGNQKVAEIDPIHCLGMRGDQAAAYIGTLLQSLREQFGVHRFEDVIKELPVAQCPIAGCQNPKSNPLS